MKPQAFIKEDLKFVLVCSHCGNDLFLRNEVCSFRVLCFICHLESLKVLEREDRQKCESCSLKVECIGLPTLKVLTKKVEHRP